MSALESKRSACAPKSGVKSLVFSLSSSDFGVWLDSGSEKHVGEEFAAKKWLKSNKNDVLRCVKRLQLSISGGEIRTPGENVR
jgi:hypothetical protein